MKLENMRIRVHAQLTKNGYIHVTANILDGEIVIANANCIIKKKIANVGDDGGTMYIAYEDFERETLAAALFHAELAGVELTEKQRNFVEEHIPTSYLDEDDDDDDRGEQNTYEADGVCEHFEGGEPKKEPLHRRIIQWLDDWLWPKSDPMEEGFGWER